MAIKPKKVKLTARQRRKIGVRKKIAGSDERPRLSVFRSNKHIYAQIISDESNRVIASASTQQKDVVDRAGSVSIEGLEKPSKSLAAQTAAKAVGLAIAEKAKAQNVKQVCFDRNGYLYHGRIKAIADGAREGGLEF